MVIGWVIGDWLGGWVVLLVVGWLVGWVVLLSGWLVHVFFSLMEDPGSQQFIVRTQHPGPRFYLRSSIQNQDPSIQNQDSSIQNQDSSKIPAIYFYPIRDVINKTPNAD